MAPSPTPDPEPATLEEAIADSHPERLVETLIAVCEKSAEAKAIVSGLLLSDIKTDTVKDTGKKKLLAGQKRKRWEACQNCDEEFNVDDNREGSCNWHEGMLERNPDAPLFKDPGIEVDDDADPEEIGEDYPEAVRFTCCKKQGDGVGCQIGKHKLITAEKMARMSDLLREGVEEGDDEEET